MSGTQISTVPEKIRDDFSRAGVSPNFDVIQTGLGQTIDWNTASALRIDLGTQVGETILRSKRSFEAPFRVMFLPLLTSLISQRVANQEIELRISSKDGTEYASWLFDGTSHPNAKLRSGNGGIAMADAATGGLVAGTDASGAFELELFIDECYWHNRTADSPNARGTSLVRNRRIPDPNVQLFIEIRTRNTAAATAGTILALDAVLLQDINELTAEITGGRGGGAASQGVPVVAAGGAALPVNLGSNFPILSLNAVDTTINNAALAASATFTQAASLDVGATPAVRPNRERLVVKADAAALGGVASLMMQESLDGTTWREVYRSPLPLDGSAHSYDVPVRTRYRRWNVINGATAMTNLFIQSRLFQFDGPTDQHENLEIPLTPAAGQALAANASFTGPVIDLGSNHMWDKVRALFFSDQASVASTVSVAQSLDGVNWLYPGTAAYPNNLTLAANQTQLIEQPIVGRYLRLSITNSTTAATSLRIVAGLVSL